MKSIFSFLLIFIFSVTAAWAQEDCTGSSCLPAKVKSDCTIMETNGCIDWENGVIYATGMGVPNPTFETQAQRTYSAYQAAKTVAMRNLLQVVEGINITSKRTVKAGMLEDDTINTQISGKIRQVQEASRPRTMNDGSVWVTMKMYMRDIISILVNNQQFQFSGGEMFQREESAASSMEKEEAEDAGYGGDESTLYTGLIIDARGAGVTPAMSPKIFDPDGKEVYGSLAVEREFALEHGIVGYVKDIEKAKSNDRVKGNPLIIKAHRQGDSESNLLVSEENAELLRKLDRSQSFLREARVIVILG